MAHVIEVIPQGGFDYTFRCRCGATRAEGWRTYEMAEDAGNKHLADIERLRRTMRSNTMSLEAEHAHFVAMAENKDVSESDRRLWRLLADDSARRLGMFAPREEQMKLFALIEPAKSRSNPT